jgi:hypothetical protein
MEKIKPLTLEIEKELWDKFKEFIPRTTTLNEAVVDLIKKELNIEENKEFEDVSEEIDYYKK